ncbi:hypothetical protein JL720_7195 [Aureococcus anophagefferens]|nr:hypothetical protein JL720_7195 [Aureococcus anophagefferens]
MDGERSGLKKEKGVRLSNIMAAKAIADAIRTRDDTVDDGAAQVAEPVDLGDRGAADARAGHDERPRDFTMRRSHDVDAVATCLSSKVIAQNSDARAAAVGAVLESSTPLTPRPSTSTVKIVKQVGGTVDDTELVDGIVFAQGAKKAAGGPTPGGTRGDIPDAGAANAKIGLIQFCLSAPKTDMENSVVVSDYAAMDRLLREERKHVLGRRARRRRRARRDGGPRAGSAKVKKAGVTVLLIQKSILRDAYNDLSLHFLAKMGILVVADVAPRAAFDRRSGRSRPRFGTLELGRIEVAHVDSLEAATLGAADLVHEVSMPGSSQKVVKVTGVARAGEGSNKLVLEEADRSLHDALCVVRSLVKEKFLVAGGGSAEVEASLGLADAAAREPGPVGFCLRAFADALEVVPYTLAENAGLNPIDVVTSLPGQHKRATFPTSKAPFSAVFHSFRLIFGRAIISRTASADAFERAERPR